MYIIYYEIQKRILRYQAEVDRLQSSQPDKAILFQERIITLLELQTFILENDLI